MKGNKITEEQRASISKAVRGKPSWNKGLKGYTNKGSFKKGNSNPHKGDSTWVNSGTFKSGSKHPNWKGGKSFEPYFPEFNYAFKKEIRKRDKYTCQECEYTEERLGYKLTVHHIDYDKVNNSRDNLICLCRSCHSQTNYGREDWTNYFLDKCKGGEYGGK